MSDLHRLKERIEQASGPNFRLEQDLKLAIAAHMFAAGASKDDVILAVGGNLYDNPPPWTASLDAALALVERLLPDFWVTSGLCSLTGHASIGPDYNGPNGDRLRQEWPEGQFHGGFDADLAPGDGRHRQCLAILHCLIQAMIARAALRPKGESHE